MAIKTKRISDLDTIMFDNGSVILGCNGGTTGKIEYETIYNAVSEMVNEVVEKLNINSPSEQSTFDLRRSVEDDESISDLKNEIEKLKLENEIISEQHKKLQSEVNYIVSRVLQMNEDVNKRISDNDNDINKTIQFIKELQKDGYLTLAEIKKAASRAFPVTDTSEEE